MELSQLHEVQICYQRVNGPSGTKKGLEAPIGSSPQEVIA